MTRKQTRLARCRRRWTRRSACKPRPPPSWTLYFRPFWTKPSRENYDVNASNSHYLSPANGLGQNRAVAGNVCVGGRQRGGIGGEVCRWLRGGHRLVGAGDGGRIDGGGFGFARARNFFCECACRYKSFSFSSLIFLNKEWNFDDFFFPSNPFFLLSKGEVSCCSSPA